MRKTIPYLLLGCLAFTFSCGQKKGASVTGKIDKSVQEQLFRAEPLSLSEMRTMDGKPVRSLPMDSLVLSDPSIFPDEETGMYYMTGTGGALWRSKDLKLWEGAFDVVELDSSSWMGKHPQIWAAELHKYMGKYYYFATFTNPDTIIDVVAGTEIPRRASQILVADRVEGPYRLINKNVLLPAGEPSLDGTFFVDELNAPYMIYCHEWLQNWNGTVQIIRLTDDLSKMMGDPYILFTASDCPWSAGEDSLKRKSFSPVTDGPYLFTTKTERLGMIWSTWVNGVYALGAAYSETGTLNGPWIQEAKPLLKDNSGHGTIFTTFEGKTLMSLHRQVNLNGRRSVRKPYLLEVDVTGDKLKIVGPYRP